MAKYTGWQIFLNSPSLYGFGTGASVTSAILLNVTDKSRIFLTIWGLIGVCCLIYAQFIRKD